MDRVKKFVIDISTEENKQKILELFKQFKYINDIFTYFSVKRTPSNREYVQRIADEIGFDISSYEIKRKRYCLECGKELKRGQKKFCSSSCAATYNNKGRKHSDETKNKIAITLSKCGIPVEKESYCVECGKELNTHQTKFCSIKCFHEHQYKNNVEEWKKLPNKYSSESISSTIKKYLMEKYNSKCQKCGWGEKNETTGKIPLEVHHIDGDCTNNSEDNLQLLCPNCHSLTPNHGSLNKFSKRYKLKRYKNLIKKLD